MNNEKDHNGYTAEQRDAIVEQCKPINCKEAYIDFLDDCYGEIDVCGHKYSAADVLESVDPIAFRCGVSDFFYNGDYVEVEGETYHKDEADRVAGEVED